jgi:hypothetical protein
MHMIRRLLLSPLPLLLAVVAVFAGGAMAQEEVGTLASVLGVVQVQRPGSETWEQVQVGAPVLEGEQIRTGSRSAARIVFDEGSVVEMGASTLLKATRLALAPVGKRYLSLVSLLEGKLHVLVGEQYGVEGSHFEVETPAAVASSRAGQFVVLYDPKAETATVAGLDRDVAVAGTIGLIGPGVTVRPKTATQVRRGRFPTAAASIDPQTLRVYLTGFATLGTGNPDEGIGAGHPALNGRILRPEDMPEQVAGKLPESPTATASRPVFPEQGLPTESFADTLSPDVRVDRQPIPEYRTAHPGERPIGGVQVDF